MLALRPGDAGDLVSHSMLRWLTRFRKDTAAPVTVEPPPADSSEIAAAPPKGLEFSRPIELRDPTRARMHFELAQKALAQGRLDEAERQLRQTVSAQPDHLDALCNLGAVLKDRGRNAEAATVLESVLRDHPRTAAAAFNLGLIRISEGRWAEAAELLATAARADPQDADMHYWLGNARMGWGRADLARNAYHAALRCEPDRAEARWGLAMAQLVPVPRTQAEHEAGVTAFGQELGKLRTWFRAHPAVDGSRAVGSQQPYYLAYGEANHKDTLGEYGKLCASLMAIWAGRAGLPAPPQGRPGKLRVGIVSAHIHSHSVWHALLRGWVEHLDAKQFELHLFHTGETRDAETAWAARRVARLHHGAGDWKAWARTVVDSRLDALIYPELGMDATALRLAGCRLARLQLAGWGHPITSGLPTIDAYVSAEAFETGESSSHYTERLIALPRLGCCYSPYGTRAAGIDFESFGIDASDRVLLCAGSPFKYAPMFDAVLLDIVRRCGPCKLVFFQDPRSSMAGQLRDRLRSVFDAAKLRPEESLCFVPWQSQAAFFAWLDRADLYLDTLGFSGFNTTMQAMERGTPVVAYEGRFMRGRFASAILRQAGLGEWVADTPQGFVDRVAKLMSDAAARAALRVAIESRRRGLYGDSEVVVELGRRIAQLLETRK